MVNCRKIFEPEGFDGVNNEASDKTNKLLMSGLRRLQQ
jgi:hypothetical protein